MTHLLRVRLVLGPGRRRQSPYDVGDARDAVREDG
jgi:hypothetical protein